MRSKKNPTRNPREEKKENDLFHTHFNIRKGKRSVIFISPSSNYAKLTLTMYLSFQMKNDRILVIFKITKIYY